MFAAKEDKWHKACKKLSVDGLRATISNLQQEQDVLLAKGPLDSSGMLSEITRKIQIANRVLGTKERGGYVSR